MLHVLIRKSQNYFTSLSYNKTRSSTLLIIVTLVLLPSCYVPILFISSGHVMRPQEVLPEKKPNVTKLIFPLIIKISYYVNTINYLIN